LKTSKSYILGHPETGAPIFIIFKKRRKKVLTKRLPVARISLTRRRETPEEKTLKKVKILLDKPKTARYNAEARLREPSVCTL